ncbi:MAG: hypothetical protein LKF58_02500 [Bacilli bacterium]|jgi:hypothetical protein|nr:hypothetical protein [Bacilli bacterium]MCH4210634.1 hypothetical protein [Bacilli bacterium]MCI2055082.1 hypothetical protein [Bacilli bacterium]
MINFLIWSLVLTLSVSMFGYTRNLGHVHRALESIDTYFMEQFVMVPSLYDYPSYVYQPCFDEEYLVSSLNRHLKENLYGYVDENSWSISYTFSAYQEEGILPQRVDFKFKASFYLAYDFNANKAFEVKKGDIYVW